jgi:hypothetical protein
MPQDADLTEFYTGAERGEGEGARREKERKCSKKTYFFQKMFAFSKII